MTRPLLLDLFCGAGGAAMGYHQAGFDVIGVDIDPQPFYPFEFRQADAFDILDRLINDEPPFDGPVVDAIHASPPCQGYTTMNNRRGLENTPRLVPETRSLLRSLGVPYVIENVVGARRAMISPVSLHGGMFGLDLYRPRLFETNWLLFGSEGAVPRDAAAVYGKCDGRRLWTRSDGTILRVATLERARAAMGMDWADWDGIREAIPPAYTEFIGHQLAAQLTGF